MTKKEVEETEDTEATESEEEEEESSEEEESEDTEESSEEGESEETEEEESTEEEPEQILDLKKVRPELREAARRMLASHTKSMQKVKAQFEEWKSSAEKELQETYSAAIVKAKGFDQITKLAPFQLFWEDLSNGRPYGFSSEFRKTAKPNSEDDSSADSEGKVSVDSIMRQLTPMITKVVEDAVGPLKSAYTNNQWKAAEENLPNFNKYRARVTAIMAEHPTLSITQAFQLAAPDEVIGKKVDKIITDAKEVAKKVPKGHLKPGSSGVKPLTTETINSVKDAMRAAQNKLLGATGG